MFELFVDGQRVAECKPGGTLTLDTAKVADGYHELRVVAIGPAPIESQGRQIIPVRLDNHGRKIEVSAATQGVLRRNTVLRIAVQSPGSIGIVAVQGSRIVGRVAGAEGQIEIPVNTLGAGPVQLRVAGLGEGSAADQRDGPTAGIHGRIGCRQSRSAGRSDTDLWISSLGRFSLPT